MTWLLSALESPNIQNWSYQFNDIGHEGIAGLLVEKGADINAIDKFGNTALITALAKGIHWTVVKLLRYVKEAIKRFVLPSC